MNNLLSDKLNNRLDIFVLIVSTFHGLSDINSPSFGRRVVILETLATYRSCVVMLDLECDDLVHEMFSTFFAVARARVVVNGGFTAGSANGGVVGGGPSGVSDDTSDGGSQSRRRRLWWVQACLITVVLIFTH